jgi:hypothetical protein
MKRHFRFSLLAIIFLFPNQNTALAGGSVATCDEASLRAALVGGGSVTFAASGTIALANTLVITNDTSIDADGQAVTLSGNNAVRIFNVNPGVSLTLKQLALRNGLAQGTNGLDGASGFDGGPGQGGAVYLNSGNLLATDCVFSGSTARGGDVIFVLNSTPARTGGMGQGGAVYSFGGQVMLTNCTLSANSTRGGIGGWGVEGTATGGNAAGGAIYSIGGQVQLADCLFSSNLCVSGRGQFHASDGSASGGAIHLDGGSHTLIGNTFTANGSQVPIGHVLSARGELSP